MLLLRLVLRHPKVILPLFAALLVATVGVRTVEWLGSGEASAANGSSSSAGSYVSPLQDCVVTEMIWGPTSGEGVLFGVATGIERAGLSASSSIEQSEFDTVIVTFEPPVIEAELQNFIPDATLMATELEYVAARCDSGELIQLSDVG